MFDSSFLCLDIGTSGVRGIAHHVKSARIAKSAVFSIDSTDTVFAIKSVVDELEKQLGVNLDSAYITGNFGPSKFDISAKNTIWNGEHKISQSDIQHLPYGYFLDNLCPDNQLQMEYPCVQL